MQDRISTDVVAMLAPSVHERELQRAMRKHPDSMTGYDYLLRAIEVMYRTERETFDQARGLLQQAIASSPGWATPRSHAAFWHMVRINQGWSPDRIADFTEAARLAASAVARDPSDAVALSIQALMLCFTERDYTAATRLTDRAIAAGPNCALAWGITSFVRGYRGDWYGGWEAGHRALRLSPFAPLTSFYEHAISQAHFIGGDHAAAVEWARHADARNPGFTSNQRVLIAALVATGALEEARARARRMLEVDPGFRLSAFAARSSLSGRILEDFVALLRTAGLPD
jgi:tetratricopeptide (TPR) repeat protein